MKSLSDRSAAAFALFLVWVSWSSFASAGVSPLATEGRNDTAVPSNERHRPSGDRELTSSREASERNRSESIIQCWQKGRLILDERDWKAGSRGIPGPELHSDSGRFARLKMMQFGETFCILRHDVRQ